MVEGVAEYHPAGKEPYRTLLREDVIKSMDPTFAGRPVFLDHVPGVDDEKLGTKELVPDGYVSESFFNKSDGKHWAKFIITTDQAEMAIQRGEVLSNAYTVTDSSEGGKWHNVDYAQEVLEAHYEHMAIVAKPRYEESIVLTPEQFKDYNLKKESELLRLTNSKEQEGNFIMKFWKKEAVQNSVDVENLAITLDNGKTITVLEAAKTAERVMNMSGYAADDHMVKMENGEMSVKDMRDKFNSMCKKNAEDEEASKKKNSEEEEKKKNAEEEEKKKNAEEEEKKKNAALEEDKEKKQNSKDGEDFFEALSDKAPKSVQNSSEDCYEDRSDKIARGKSRY
jgi:hypothetical protein